MGIVKGIAKAVKNVVKGVKTVFKKVTSTTVGKVLLAGAAGWLGGAALGMWNSPFASINGALTSAGSQAAAGNAAAPLTGAADTAATGAAATGGAIDAVADTGLSSAPTGIETMTITAPRAAAGGMMGPASTAAATLPEATVQPTALAAGTKSPGMLDVGSASSSAPDFSAFAKPSGLISKLMKPVSSMMDFADKHPMAALMTVNGLGSALSPDAIDLEQERNKQHQADLQRWQQNMAVGDVSLGFKPNRQPLQYLNGQPVYTPVTGAINLQRRT